MQSVGDVYITHAWSRTPETAQKAAREFGIPNVVDRWEEIVDSPQIDAVVIATPPNLHLPATLAALDAGKHVLSQARMARNLSEALRMFEASKATDFVTALYPAGFGLKGDRVMRRLLHDEGYVGEILEVRVTSVVSSIPEVGAWVVDPEVVGVNTMMLAYRIDRRLTDFAGPDCDATLSFSPNPPKDTDGRREGSSGRGWVRELQGRWPGVLG